MKTLNKLILLLSVTLSLFIVGFFLFQQKQLEQQQIFIEESKKEQKDLVDRILFNKSKELEQIIFQQNRNDVLISFIQGKQSESQINQHFYYILNQLNIDAVWVFDPLFDLRFFYCPLYKNTISKKYIPLPDKAFKLLPSQSSIAFYLMTDLGIFQIQGTKIFADIVAQQENDLQGFIFMGKRWDNNFLKDIELISGNVINVRKADAPAFKTDNNAIISYTVPLKDIEEKELAQLTFVRRFPLIQKLNEHYKYLYIYLVSLAISILGMFIFSFHHFVKRPLKLIRSSLAEHSAEKLYKLNRQQNEFSEIGLLTEKFVDHKKLLQREIENHKLTNIALQESQERYRAIVENTRDAIFIYYNYQVVFTNKAAYYLAGYNIRECFLLDLWQLVHPDDKQKIVQYGRKKIIGDQTVPPVEIRVITKNQEIKIVELTMQRIKINKENAVMGVAHDITHFRQNVQQ